MGISKTDICNKALSRIGVRSINSIDEKTPEADKCRLEFDGIKEAVLRDFPWNFATRIEPLAEVADYTVTGWSYVYIYPANCLKVWKIFNAATINLETKQPHRIIGSNTKNDTLILCNLTQAYMEYAANIQDTTRFDPSFVDALAWRLAAALAPALKTGMSIDKIMGTYQLTLDRAKKNNASEGYQEKPVACKYIDGR